MSKVHVVNGSTNSLLTKNDLQSCPCDRPVKLGTNLTRTEILKLKNAGFQLPQKELITPTCFFNTSTPPQPTQTLILLPSSHSLWDGLPPHHQQNNYRWWHIRELWTGLSSKTPWFHAPDLVAWSCCSPNLHLHNQFTNSQWALVNPKPPPLSIVVQMEAYGSHILDWLHLAIGTKHPILQPYECQTHKYFIQSLKEHKYL